METGTERTTYGAFRVFDIWSPKDERITKEEITVKRLKLASLQNETTNLQYTVSMALAILYQRTEVLSSAS